MKRSERHIKSQDEQDLELQKIISSVSIAWPNSKEDIWLEMLAKISNPHAIKKPVFTLYARKIAAAAVFAILFGASALFYFYTRTISNYSSNTVTVTLPDNSTILVYNESTIAYKPLMWWLERDVKLTGEALFEVEKGSRFEVISPNGKTVVLGTQFIVYSRNNEYNVKCISGKVKVIGFSKQKEKTITAGQQVIMNKDGNLEIIDNTETITKQEESPDQKSEENILDDILNSSKDLKGLKVTPTNSILPKRASEPEKLLKSDNDENTGSSANKQHEDTRSNTQVTAMPLLIPDESRKISTQDIPSNENNIDEPRNPSIESKTDKFKESLTKRQIKILEDKTMSEEERKKAFMNALTLEQRNLLQEQNQERQYNQESQKEISKPGVNDQHESQILEQARDRENKKGARQEQRSKEPLKTNESTAPENNKTGNQINKQPIQKDVPGKK